MANRQGTFPHQARRAKVQERRQHETLGDIFIVCIIKFEGVFIDILKVTLLLNSKY
jgi:hypothetical protein